MKKFVLALLLPGCSPCVELCRVEAGHLNRCLDEWDLGWSDLGARDRADHRLRCERDQRRWTEQLADDPDLRAEEEQRCTRLNTELRAAATCEATWEVLTAAE